MQVLVFAGSNSSQSINKQLVGYLAQQCNQLEVRLIDLSKFDIPLYSIDIENKAFPKDVLRLHKLIQEYPALIMSVNEHNGAPSAFIKNITDWLSRLDREFLAKKEVLLFSTSTGKYGGAKALAYYKEALVKFGANLVNSYSFPLFNENFSEGEIINSIQAKNIKEILTAFENNTIKKCEQQQQ